MTTAPYEGSIPEFTQADRLRKARNLTGLRVPEFAERMGVSPKTINNAESERHEVRKIVLNQWALITGVPLQWLETGIAPEPGDGPEGDGLPVRHQGLEPRTRWYEGKRPGLRVLKNAEDEAEDIAA